MNCKPGDLAVVVHTFPEAADALGRVVRLGSSSVDEYGDVVWTYAEMPLRGFVPGKPLQNWTWHALPDAWLRPIRDPGEDAQDETLAWKPVPAGEREPETA